MLAPSRRVLLIAVLLAVAIIAVLIGFLSGFIGQLGQAGTDLGRNAPNQQWWQTARWILTLPKRIGPEWIIAIATTIYAWFAFRQWQAIHRQADTMTKMAKSAEDTAEATRRTAEAAIRNTETLVSLESPKVFIREVVLHKHGTRYGDLQVGANIQLVVVNYGRTPALLIEYCIECVFDDGLPETPHYASVIQLTDMPALEQHETYPLGSPPAVLLSEDLVRSVEKGNRSLWLYGYIGFGDILQNTWRVGFCYRWTERDAQGHKGFRHVGLDKYNYYTRE